MLNKTKRWLKTTKLTLLLSFALVTGMSGSALASTGPVAQGYGSTSALQPGMIVQLDSKNPNDVIPLEMSSINKMLGIVVSSNEAAITLGNSNSTNQVFVTNYGQHDVLVSNQNGSIKVGDYITISNLSGVGMKADDSESLVLGQAAASFNGNSGVVGSSSLTESNGQKTSVNLGLIPVDISIANNPLAVGPKGVPEVLRKITRFATNRSVSDLRVYLSTFIVLVGLVLATTIIYSGVRNGIISLGRNPLARRIIDGGMERVIVVGIIVFVISLGVAYAILL